MPTVQMNLTLPDTTTRGPDYVALNNDAFLAIDAHDHTTGRGARLPTAALDINTDLPLNEHKLVDALGVSLLQLGAPLTDPTDVATLYCVAGDLYYNNEDGYAVQVTSGNSINVSGVAGIGGDYSGSAAQLTYTDATKNYLFTSAPGQRANLQAATLELTHPTLAKVDMGNSQGSVRRHTLEAASFGFALTDATAGRVVADYVSGATGETDRLELMPANSAPVLVGATLLHLAQARLPLQLSTAAAGTDAHLGINKNGAEGLAIGYANATTGAAGTLAGTGGVIRMLSTDPLLVAHQGAITASWRAAGLTIGPEDGSGPQAPLSVRSAGATSAQVRVDGTASSSLAQVVLRSGASAAAQVSYGTGGTVKYTEGLDAAGTYTLRDVANSRDAIKYDPSANKTTLTALQATTLQATAASVASLASSGAVTASSVNLASAVARTTYLSWVGCYGDSGAVFMATDDTPRVVLIKQSGVGSQFIRAWLPLPLPPTGALTQVFIGGNSISGIELFLSVRRYVLATGVQTNLAIASTTNTSSTLEVNMNIGPYTLEPGTLVFCVANIPGDVAGAVAVLRHVRFVVTSTEPQQLGTG